VDKHGIYWSLISYCPFLRDGIEVFDGDKFKYNENGIDFIISYSRIASELQPIEVWPEVSDPIIGEGSIDGGDIQYEW
jgi:hypothetical protein